MVYKSKGSSECGSHRKMQLKLLSTSGMKIYWEKGMRSVVIPGEHLGLQGASFQSWLEARNIKLFSYFYRNRSLPFL